MEPTVIAVLKDHAYRVNVDPFVHQLNLADTSHTKALMKGLKNKGVPWKLNTNGSSPARPDPEDIIISSLAQNGFLEFKSARQAPAVVLSPSSQYFEVVTQEDVTAAVWKVSRFTYIHHYEGEMVLRNPQALCYLTVNDAAVLNLVFQCNQPVEKTALAYADSLAGQEDTLFMMLVKAQIILPCDDDHQTAEDKDPVQRQWEFHDLLFHASSRIGRTEKPIGGTFRFKGILDPQPPVKPHPWNQEVIPLPVPNLQDLFFRDMPLTAALETRRSTRSHSIIPLTIGQLGEFLYRTVRNRYYYSSEEYGDFTSRPHPGGGANYEDEIYVTVSACIGVKRGFYYYDPKHHTLCLVKEPCADMEALLDEAYMATARLCRPQILLTIASRFNRFNWKYAGMSYATQLKNVGVIYQTMYLVATAMNIGACGLGTGNADRFRQLTGLKYLEEGSLGEFMLGRPL